MRDPGDAGGFDCLAVIGVGLIGGSFALAARRRGVARRVVAAARKAETLAIALDRGIADEVTDDPAQAAAQADLVYIAAPVRATESILQAIAPVVRPDALVTDAGSTKRDVVAAIHRHLGPHLAQVVPAHPIAGAENSGVEAAFADLYSGRKVVLTPLAQSSPEAVERVRAAWQACGATVVDMTPEALRRRLAHGNVYPADRIDAAMSNYFRPGNLAALRELALLWVADRVEDQLQEYLLSLLHI